MRFSHAASLLTCGLVGLWAADVPAQSRSGSSSGGVQSISPQTTSSTSGTGSGGSGAGGSSGAGNSTLFGSSSTGAGSGRGSSGQTGQAGAGLQGPQFNQFGQAAGSVGDGFVGRSDNMGRFVGSETAGQQTLDSGAFTNFGGLGGGRGGGQGGGQTPSQTRGAEMRIQQRIAFTVPAVPPVAIQGRLQAQFMALQARFPDVTALMGAGGQLTLTGVVESLESRSLAEAVARLEPGVSSIDNQLQIAAPAAAAPSGPLVPSTLGNFGN
jgi:hypothetical protein